MYPDSISPEEDRHRYDGMNKRRLTTMTPAEREDYYNHLYKRVSPLLLSLAVDTVDGLDELQDGAEHFAYSAACNAFMALLDSLAALGWIVNPEDVKL